MVLIYHPPVPSRRKLKPNLPRESTQLNFHCDQVCSSKDGKYLETKNSQVRNTPVAILTWGGSRTLHFQLIWKDDRGAPQSKRLKCVQLGHLFLFFLDPRDEDPLVHTGELTFRQIRHGDVKSGGSEDISIAIVFRTVKGIVHVNTETGLMKCDGEMTQKEYDAMIMVQSYLTDTLNGYDCNEDHEYMKKIFMDKYEALGYNHM